MTSIIQTYRPELQRNRDPLLYLNSRWLGRHVNWVLVKTQSDKRLVALTAKVWSIALPILLGCTLIFFPLALRLYFDFQEARRQLRPFPMLVANRSIVCNDLEQESFQKMISELDEIRSSILENEILTQLFTLSDPTSQLTVKHYFEQIGQQKVLEIFEALIQKYQDMFKSLDEVSVKELNIKNPDLQDRLAIHKGCLIDDIYGKYATAVYKISQSYPELFEDKIVFAPSKREFYPCTAIMPAGMAILLEMAEAKGRFTGTSLICNGYQEYTQKLHELQAEEGRWYCFIRCKEEEGNKTLHTSTVIIERKQERTIAFILDSGGIGEERGFLKHFVVKLCGLTKNVFPAAEIFTPMMSRQNDAFNCATIAYKGILAFERMGEKEFSDLLETSVPAIHLLPEELASVRASSLPLSCIKTIQSLSSLDAIIEAQSQNAAGVQQLKRLKRIFTVRDPRMNKNMYAYTKMHGLKLRLAIMARTFQSQKFN